jgi:hypothetical protein
MYPDEATEVNFFSSLLHDYYEQKDFSEGKSWRKNLSFVLSFIKARRMCQ